MIDEKIDLSGFRVLFVYPSQKTKPRIPLACSILIAQLRSYNATVRLFDTTYMTGDPNYSDKTRGKIGYVKKSDIADKYGKIAELNPEEELIKVLDDFKPALVALTLLEHTYSMAMRLLPVIKKHSDAPILVGGIMPTIAPEMIIKNQYVDMVCIGEGEGPLIDVSYALKQGQSYQRIGNLWVKERPSGQVLKNPARPFVELDSLPFQDWSDFDERSLYKAYCGKAYRCGSFELTRGCLKGCSFCVAPAIRKHQEGAEGCYRRTKTPERLVEEMVMLVGKYKLEMIHFCDTEFLLGMKTDFLEKLTDIYKKQINLPFIMQTGAETITEEKLKIIKDAGCQSMSIGVESGVAEFRKRVLNKFVSDEVILRAFELAKKIGIRTTANYMIGLPFETEEDILQTIEFNKKLQPPSISVCYFVPFVGTQLYDVCLAEGFYPEFDPDADIFSGSCLNLPNISKERIEELTALFVEEQNKIEQSQVNTGV